MLAIINRELVTMLRTNRALAVQVGLVLLLATLVIVRWPTDARVDLDGAAAQQVMRVFGYGLMVGLILLAPVFPATSIVKEKVQGTLALLLNSPIHPWAIAIGKLVGMAGFVLLLVVLSIPAAAACFAMGGIDLVNGLGAMYLVLVLLAIQYATLGLLVSSYASTTDSSLRVTYGIILILAIVTLGPYQFLAGVTWLGPMGAAVIDWVRCISPVTAMMSVLGDEGVGSGGLVGAGGVVGRYCLVAAVSSVVFMIWTATRLNMRVLDRSREAGTMTDDRSAGAQVFRRIMYLWFFDPQRRSGLIGPMTNPVMVKEQRCRRFGRGNWMMRLIGACLIISMLLMLAALTLSIDNGVETMGGIMVLLQISLIVLLTPSLASGLISGERESRGWQLLQMTPLSALSIVMGKLLSVIVTLVLVLLATLPAYAVLIYVDPGQWQIALYVLLTLTLTALLALLISAAVSSVFENTAAATATSYGILVALFAGTMLFWLGQDAPFSRDVVETALAINPLAAALELLDTPGFDDYQLVPLNWYLAGGLCALSLLVLMVQVWRLTRPR